VSDAARRVSDAARRVSDAARTVSDAAPTGRGATEAHGAAAPPGASSAGRSRRPLLIGAVVGVIALAAAAVAVLDPFDGGPDAPDPQTVVLPAPTPTVAPVERAAVSAFADSLPGSVLEFALTSLAEHPALLAAGALEGYRLDYSDGGPGAVTVLAGQWPTAEEAAAAAATAAAATGVAPPDADEPTSGEVVVAGVAAGTWTLTQGTDGTGALTWSNGTAMLQAIGPPDVVRDVYAAYPM